jgi:hypothetical protein
MKMLNETESETKKSSKELIETVKKDLMTMSETPVSFPVIPLLQGALNEKTSSLFRAALFGLMRSCANLSHNEMSTVTQDASCKSDKRDRL